MNAHRRLLAGALALAAAATQARPQQRGAELLDQQLRGLTTTARVLIIGAHPDDEDTRLIAWLARGHQVQTAYLSLTRGESGNNFAGADFGEMLGAVRTEEVLLARRLDGGEQFFTRAFDFGLSKSAKESYDHWPHDALLGDVVTALRAFRPHVVIALFSGTPADSDGHHEVSALLAREAYDVAADTVQFPVAKHGFPWQPLKLYGPGQGLTIDAGGYDPVAGRTYTELAAVSREQHRTQGYRDSLSHDIANGDRLVSLARIASRVNDSTPASRERSLFDGIDTTFARLAEGMTDSVRSAITLAIASADSARSALDLRRPDAIVGHLARAVHFISRARNRTPRCLHPNADASGMISSRAGCRAPWLDVDASLDLAQRRAAQALLTASGVSIEMRADRELVAYSDTLVATLTLANHGRDSVQLITASINGAHDRAIRFRTILPDSVARWTTPLRVMVSTEPWWFGQRFQELHPEYLSALDGVGRAPSTPGLITVPAVAIPETIRRATDVTVTLRTPGEVITTSVGPIVFRAAEPLVGVQDRPVSGVPSVALGFDHNLEWIPTGKPIDRLVRFSMRSYADSERSLTLKLVAPPGVRIDSLPKKVQLRPHEGREMLLRMRGSLAQGRFEFGLIAYDAGGASFDEGIRTIQYPHLRPIHVSRGSAMWLAGVEIVVPSRLNVAYLPGVGDVITPYLRQLGVTANVLGYDELLNTDLSQFTTVVVGVRAYEAHPELVAYNTKLLDFVRRGGTLVVQGGAAATYSLGVFPYILDAAPNGELDRVTVEDAPVQVLDPRSRLLNWPNKISDADWRGWVTERAAYMPRVFDPRYSTPLEMHDPGEPEHRGALVVTTIGKGTYIYTTLALHRQLLGAVPGGARLLVNLLSAGLSDGSGAARARPSAR